MVGDTGSSRRKLGLDPTSENRAKELAKAIETKSQEGSTEAASGMRDAAKQLDAIADVGKKSSAVAQQWTNALAKIYGLADKVSDI